MQGSSSVPKGRFVVVVNGTIPRSVRPIPVSIAVILRSALQLILGYADPVAAEIGVVLQDQRTGRE